MLRVWVFHVLRAQRGLTVLGGAKESGGVRAARGQAGARRRASTPGGGTIKPPLQDGHPQPLEQTVHTSPATLQKELYALMLFTAMPGRSSLTLQGEWLLGVHHRQAARRILVPKSQSGKLATILKLTRYPQARKAFAQNDVAVVAAQIG